MTNRTQVTLAGVEKRYITYQGVDPGSGCAKFEEGTPHEVPVGAIVQQTARVLMDVLTSDGEKFPGIEGFPLEVGPRIFLRGRVVEGEEAQKLLVPPELRELQAMLGGMLEVEVMTIGSEGENLRVVAITQSDGTEVALPLRDDDVPPPKDASPYAVGESPEEVAAAKASKPKRRFCPDCLQDDHPVDPETALTADEAAQARSERAQAQVRAMAGVMGDEDPDEYDFDDAEEFTPEHGGEGGN